MAAAKDDAEGAEKEDAAMRRSMDFWPKGWIARCCGRIPVRFRDAEKERQFREHRKPLLQRVVRRIFTVALAAHILAVALDVVTVDFADPSRAERIYLACLSIVALTSILGIACRLPEVLLPWVFAVAEVGILTTTRTRAAFLSGESLIDSFEIAAASPQAYCMLLSDAVLVGNIAILVVVYYVVLPVRAAVSWWMLFGIPFIYLAMSLPLTEKDGGAVRTLTLAFRLEVGVVVGYMGRCQIEMAERSAFLRIHRMRKDLLNEKTLRFQAEHAAENGPFSAGSREASAECGCPECPSSLPAVAVPSGSDGGLDLSEMSGAAPAAARPRQHSDEVASMATSVVSRPLSSIIFTPSETRDVPLEMQMVAMKAVAAQEKWLIDWSEVSFEDSLLGRGGYAMVVEGRFAGARVAVKMPSKDQLTTSREISDFFGKELRVLRHLRHPFIVNFYGACMEESKKLVVLIEEYIDGASLHDVILLRQDIRLSQETRWQILSSVAHALAYLHGQGPTILHGDLSAKNIMLRAGSHEPVLIDFGMAVLQKSRQKIQGGSPRWMAPELLVALSHGGLQPDCSVDIFAFGRISFFVSTGKLPLQDIAVEELLAAANRGALPAMAWPEQTPETELASFCEAELCPRCLQTDPESRCSAVEACAVLREQRPVKFDALGAAESVMAGSLESTAPPSHERFLHQL